MSFVNSSGEKEQPYMIHRALLAFIERFGILIEHYAGWFPTWLAPIQCQIITISDAFNDYATTVKKDLLSHGVRVEMDISSEN